MIFSLYETTALYVSFKQLKHEYVSQNLLLICSSDFRHVALEKDIQ